MFKYNPNLKKIALSLIMVTTLYTLPLDAWKKKGAGVKVSQGMKISHNKGPVLSILSKDSERRGPGVESWNETNQLLANPLFSQEQYALFQEQYALSRADSGWGKLGNFGTLSALLCTAVGMSQSMDASAVSAVAPIIGGAVGTMSLEMLFDKFEWTDSVGLLAIPMLAMHMASDNLSKFQEFFPIFAITLAAYGLKTLANGMSALDDWERRRNYLRVACNRAYNTDAIYDKANPSNRSPSRKRKSKKLQKEIGKNIVQSPNNSNKSDLPILPQMLALAKQHQAHEQKKAEGVAAEEREKVQKLETQKAEVEKAEVQKLEAEKLEAKTLESAKLETKPTEETPSVPPDETLFGNLFEEEEEGEGKETTRAVTPSIISRENL